MEVDQIAEGLWRWTTPHPEWRPDADWPEEVGCVYLETADAVVLIDPLVPTEAAERERFLAALDRDVAEAARPLVLLRTVHWHARSIDELAARYGGTLWTQEAGPPPAGVEPIDARRAEETLFFLRDHAALVAGDVLLGDDAGGVRVCSDSWLPKDVSPAEFRECLRPLLELPLERILVSHGEPVLSGGREALARALHAPSAA
jgi:glyoxylase-like metal-dependent hydrolase (beta-lactamase superfamily II)